MEDGLLALGFLGAFLGFILVSVLIAYILSAIALMLIAQKTKTPNSWLAWIPIANIFLMVFVAKKEWWWALIILLINFIPIVGSFVAMGLLVYIWWLICERLNKPGALALLMLIPVVNLVFMLYLALSK